MGHIIAMIAVGAVIGAVARLVKKGKQPIGILWTVILGALGAGIGGWIVSLFGYSNNGGIPWIEWAVAVVVAVVLIGAYMGIADKKSE